MSTAKTLNYSEWVHWLETRHIMPQIAPGLERTLAALKQTRLFGQNSQQHTIHVAGTNGKGTTAKTIEHLIRSSGESVGLYTSPHLVTTRERIQANGQMITESEFCDLCEKHFETIKTFNLSHFESLTLFALDYFLNIKKTKWMIFEIGLGGLWDATNAIHHCTSVITTIGFDHMHILGHTLLEIAKNKFGIIQKDNLVIHQKYPTDVDTLLKETVEKQNARPLLVRPYSHSVQPNLIPQYFLLYNDKKIPLSLPGVRAVENISTALTVVNALNIKVDVPTALQNLQWPARMTPLENLKSPCPVYLSGDHNLQGIDSLCEILSYSTYKKIRFVLGLSKNRSHDPFVDKISRLRDAEIYYTQPQFQGVSPDLQKYTPYFETPQMALAAALDGMTKEDLVVITGSLYLCGELMAKTTP